MGRLGFYFDMTRCIGCRACQVACKDKNRLEVGVIFRNAHTYSVGTFPSVHAIPIRARAITARSRPASNGVLRERCIVRKTGWFCTMTSCARAAEPV